MGSRRTWRAVCGVAIAGTLAATVRAQGVVSVDGSADADGIGLPWRDLVVPEEARLFATVPAAGDAYGRAVALDGDTLVVGAPQSDSPMNGPGFAEVWVRTASGWVREACLADPLGASDDLFGFAVDVSGDLVAVGAFGKSQDAGAVYVFARAAGVWDFDGLVSPLGGEPSDFFGFSVALQGTVLVVGAPNDRDAASIGAGPGAVYVFERSVGLWRQRVRLASGDVGNLRRFGWSVDVDEDGDRIAVGERALSDDLGRAFVYERNGTRWGSSSLEAARLSGSDSVLGDRFGYAVALHGSALAVGAPAAEAAGFERAGAVYSFADDGTAWTEGMTVRAPQPSDDAFFGTSLDMVADALAVGEDQFEPVAPRAGAAYVYGWTERGWLPAAVLRGGGLVGGDRYGTSVAVAGTLAAVGAQHADQAALDGGAAYVFSYRGTITSFCQALASSTGEPALLSARGPASVSLDRLVLEAQPVPAGQAGLFFYGSDEVEQPFGDGYLCIAGALHRLPPHVASGGVLRHALAIDDPPEPAGQITAGSTWKFQAWFRDPAAGLSGFNLSDGLSVTFVP